MVGAGDVVMIAAVYLIKDVDGSMKVVIAGGLR